MADVIGKVADRMATWGWVDLINGQMLLLILADGIAIQGLFILIGVLRW